MPSRTIFTKNAALSLAVLATSVGLFACGGATAPTTVTPPKAPASTSAPTTTEPPEAIASRVENAVSTANGGSWVRSTTQNTAPVGYQASDSSSWRADVYSSSDAAEVALYFYLTPEQAARAKATFDNSGAGPGSSIPAVYQDNAVVIVVFSTANSATRAAVQANH
jgi:hypothetical protein